MKESTRKRIMGTSLENLDSYQYECSKMALDHLDLDTTITFEGKHFVLTGYGHDVTCREAKLIIEKGGIIHSTMVKSADYLLVNIRSCGSGKLKKALEWRAKGSNVKIICQEMFEEAVGAEPASSATVRAENVQDADADESSIGLQKGWTRTPKTLAPVKRLLHDLNKSEFFQHPVYFRGPVSLIQQLMTRYNGFKFTNEGNGIAQVIVNNNHQEGQKLQKIIREFPCLRCAGFTSWAGAQSVFMSDSGYDVITHVEILDYTKYEGEHWIDEADVLKDGVHTVSDVRTGERWKKRYVFPYRDEWLSDQYMVRADGKHYLCRPVAGETVTAAAKSKKIAAKAYANNKQLKQLTIPEGVTEIGKEAFKNCSELVEVQLPDSLKKIGSKAFEGCEKLKAISLPDGALELGEGIFSDCEALAEVHLPEQLERIPEETFLDCENLKQINLPERLSSIGTYAFGGCGKLSGITAPENLRCIESYAFYDCRALCRGKEKFTLTDSVEVVGDKAFLDSMSEYSLLRLSQLPSGLKRIGEAVFFGVFDDKCKDLTIHSNIETIGKKSFMNNPFRKLKIEPGLRVISREAFRGCTDLWRVAIEGNLLESIERGAFNGCTALLYLIVPDGTKLDPRAADDACDVLRRKEVPDAESLLGELRQLQNAKTATGGLAKAHPFAFLLSDSILEVEADAFAALLRLGMLNDERLLRRYWKAVSLAPVPRKQSSRLALIKKNWKKIKACMNEPQALEQCLNEILG